MVRTRRMPTRALGAVAASATALAVGATLLPTGAGPTLADADQAAPRSEQASWSPTSYVAASALKPNIVVIMLDDVGAHDGRLWETLPTINSTFVQAGTEYTDFHGQSPSCSPGRAGFLTGLHTQNHGVTRNVGTLFKPGMTIATQLRKSGYYTVLSGKYLNGIESISPKVPPGWSEFHAIDKGFYGYSMWSNGKKKRYGYKPADYSTDVIARKAVASIARAPKSKPVFAYIAPYSAHTPNKPAPRHKTSPRCKTLPKLKMPGYMEKYVSDKPAYIRAFKQIYPGGYDLRPACRSLLSVDNLIRDVKAQLSRQGRLNDTLFILTADNGMNYGMHRFLNDKKSPYSTQVPFLVSWKKQLGTDPRQVDEKLLNIDLAPTLCALGGCSMGPYPTGQRRPDGRSFAPLLLGNSKALARGSVLLSFRRSGAKVPRWWGVETSRHSVLAKVGCSSRSTKGCRWSFVKYETGEKELYDLSNGPCHEWKRGERGDPCRLDNVAGKWKYRAVQKALSKRLEGLKRE